MCCGVLRCAAVCCGVLGCAAVCCGLLRCAAVCCGVLPVCCCEGLGSGGFLGSGVLGVWDVWGLGFGV